MSMHVRGMPVRHAECSTTPFINYFIIYRAQLRKYVLAHVRFDKDVDDVMQDIALRLMRAGCLGVVEPLAYLYRVAQYVLADGRTDRKRFDHVVFDSELTEELRDTLYTDDIGEVIEREQEAEQALSGIKNLKQRDAIILHGALGYSMEETATELGLSFASIDKYLTRAKRAARAVA